MKQNLIHRDKSGRSLEGIGEGSKIKNTVITLVVLILDRSRTICNAVEILKDQVIISSVIEVQTANSPSQSIIDRLVDLISCHPFCQV